MDAAASPLALLKDPTLLKTDGLIDGQWVKGKARFDVIDPATGSKLADVADLGPKETKAAITAANAAWPAWRALTAKQRHAILMKWFQLLMANQDDLGRIMTAEQCKPLPEAKGEVAYGASFVEWFAEEAKRAHGETLQTSDPTKRLAVLRQPIGVCAAITPWNFPLAMITRKVAPALAAGCPVVIKPAELTPLTALAAAELAVRAGVPAGVINVIIGTDAPAIGKVLCDSDTVRHLSFTGSTEVGRILMAQCAPTVKKLALELGGNAPFIVFDDADIDAAVEGAIASKYRNAGQTCVCANRIYVQDSIYDDFAARLVAKVAELKLGNGLDAGVTQGPLIDENAVRKIEQHIADALSKGGKLAIGGKRHALGGSFFEPSVVLEANSDMLVATEETFAPLAPLFRFGSEDEVVAMANATQFGLAGYFYSRDLGRVWRVAEELEVGMVGINTGMIANEMAPFGGVKHSGMGREGSPYGMDDFLDIKYLCMGGI